MPDARKTKVFLSCGGWEQKEEFGDLDEDHISKELIRKLRDLNYDVYFAILDQSTDGVVDDIFRNLKDSEYYLFIDFRREKLAGSKGKDLGTRGSLFTNQELAVAQFQRKKKIIAFQEKGVNGEDGILKFIKVNATEFDGRKGLVDNVVKRVQAEWDPTWKNQLVLTRKQGESSTTNYGLQEANQRPATFFHIAVKNMHLDQTAKGCLTFVEKVTQLGSGADLTPTKLVEIKWEGVTTPTVTIPPQASRSFDGIFIFHHEPTVAHLGVNPFIVDSTEFIDKNKVSAPGKYEITYVVYSDDFSPSREKFILDMDGNLGNVKFYEAGGAPVAPATPAETSIGEVTQVGVPITTGSGTTMVVTTLFPSVGFVQGYDDEQ